MAVLTTFHPCRESVTGSGNPRRFKSKVQTLGASREAEPPTQNPLAVASATWASAKRPYQGAKILAGRIWTSLIFLDHMRRKLSIAYPSQKAIMISCRELRVDFNRSSMYRSISVGRCSRREFWQREVTSIGYMFGRRSRAIVFSQGFPFMELEPNFGDR